MAGIDDEEHYREWAAADAASERIERAAEREFTPKRDALDDVNADLAAFGFRLLASLRRHDEDCAEGVTDCTEMRLRFTQDAVKAARDFGFEVGS